MRRGTLLGVIVGILVAAIATGLGAVLATSQTPVIVVHYKKGAIPLNPDASLWNSVNKVSIPLSPQMLVYPQTYKSISRTLKVAAVYNGTHFALFIEWKDSTKDVEGIPGNISAFADAVAAEFPVNSSGMPYICMGDTAHPVNIVYWAAGKGVENMVAGSGYGMQPGEKYAIGMEEATTSPVEELPPQAQIWIASAKYENGMWKVVLMRPMGSVFPLVPSFKPGESTSIAFANWEGSLDQRAGMHEISGWFTLKFAPLTTTKTTTVAPMPAKTSTITATKTVTKTTTATVTRTTTVVKANKGVIIGLSVVIVILAVALGLALIRRHTT